MANWAKNLEELSKSKSNTPKGNGWFTAIEFREKCKVGHCKAYDLIRTGLRTKKIEMFRGSRYNKEQQQNTRAVWYRFIEPN